MKRRLYVVPTVALALAFARITFATDAPVHTEAAPETRPAGSPTALSLVKKGNDYVGVQSKDKIVEIQSDKSMGTLQPNIWHVIYYDPDSTLKRVEVKFGSGQEMDVSHPVQPFKMARNGNEILDRSKIKVDSDQALDVATGQPLLKSVTLRSSKLTLMRSDVGPVWEVELWAAKASQPGRDANVGTVTVSAADGSVVRSDLRPDKAQ